MASCAINHIRKQRAECMLESDLWEVVNQHHRKKATRSETRLDRKDILRVLASMSARVANEISWGKK
jgi:hypothetical protein